MLKEEADLLTGNDRFEGFAVDLIFELSLLLEFSYTFIVEEDGNYGVCIDEQANIWTGMIGKVMSGVSMNQTFEEATYFYCSLLHNYEL